MERAGMDGGMPGAIGGDSSGLVMGGYYLGAGRTDLWIGWAFYGEGD